MAEGLEASFGGRYPVGNSGKGHQIFASALGNVSFSLLSLANFLGDEAHTRALHSASYFV
jgi:hypothetical protein